MDVWCSWPGALTNTKIDVTVRSPFASRHKNTCNKPGIAADAAAGDKHRRYGPEVWTLNFETRGRLGNDGIEVLKHLASEAMCWSPCGQRRLTQFWRTRLERTLIHAQAEGLLLCIGANAACINAVSRMGFAKRTAECGLCAASGGRSGGSIKQPCFHGRCGCRTCGGCSSSEQLCSYGRC